MGSRGILARAVDGCDVPDLTSLGDKDTAKVRANGLGVALTTLSTEAFVRKLGSADPTPGGGSVAAVVGSFGAGLVRMVAQLTAGSPKYAPVATRCHEMSDAAERLARELLQLADDDAASFDKVSDAYRLPRNTDAEKASRSQAIQAALLGAIAPPSAVIRCAREICDFAVELADIGNLNAISDVGCAALCAQTAAQGASLNVEINAGSLADKAAAKQLAARAAADVAQVNVVCEVILNKVRARTVKS
jgi:formiminotetrahydrofolate cyclodeaminase